MAYGGGVFLPSETAYKDPNRFRDVLEAEGNKQAKYLAAMDQFYAQLEEMTRQFDVTTEQRERFFEEEQAFKYEELDWKSGESELDRELKRWEVGETIGFGREQLGVQEDYYQGLLGLERGKQDYTGQALGLEEEKFGLEEEKFSFLKGIYGGVARREQETHDVAKSILGVPGEGIQPTGDYSVPTDFDWDSIPGEGGATPYPGSTW